MPRSFQNCVKGGGRVRTIILSGQPGQPGHKYMHVCYTGSGRSTHGEVKVARGSAGTSKVRK